MTQSMQSAVRDARREHILDAARAEFAEEGLDAASMRGIALRAGCTTGAIYPLFATKERIYAELLHESLARLHAAVAAAATAARSPAAAVERGAMGFVAYYEERPFELNLGLYAFHGLKRSGVGAALDKSLNAALGQALEVIARPLAEHLGLDETRAKKQTTLLLSQMIGALVLKTSGRLKTGAAGPSALVRMQVELLLNQKKET